MKKGISSFVIILFLSFALVACAQTSVITEYVPTGLLRIRTDINQIARGATHIVHAEVLDNRVERINTYMGSGYVIGFNNEIREVDISRYYEIVTIYRLSVLEVFKGDVEVGDILELGQRGGRLGNYELINERKIPIAYGDELIFFMRCFTDEGFGHLPLLLESSSQAVYHIPAPGADGSAVLESFTPDNELILTVSDLERFVEEFGGRGPIPTPTPAPGGLLSLNIFNNGKGGSPSSPNANLAQSGTIRIWTQLDGVNTPLPLSAAITAIDENDNDAMEFVRLNQRWAANQGWLEDFNYIDINKNGQWETITLSITVFDQTIEAILVNSLYTPETAPYFHTQVFEEDWRTHIVIWFYQGGPRYTNTHRVVIDDIVLYVDGERANIRDFASNVAPHQVDIPSLQIRRDLDWQEMTIIVTELGQTITHTFTN
ncbi:MAG: hypothetical protein FWE11_06985 [Defluviitaleaceae bacterium]|nr:hypothetical protein [Defluviitaleaceae bacterium]